MEPAPLFLSDYDGEPDPSESRTQPAKQSKGHRLVPNPGGRSGGLGRSTSGRAVFLGCHTRAHRQRQSLDRRRSAGSICIGAAGVRTTDCSRHAVKGSGAGDRRPPFHRWPLRELRNGRHGADARRNHRGVSIRAAEPCAGRRSVVARASRRSAAASAPTARRVIDADELAALEAGQGMIATGDIRRPGCCWNGRRSEEPSAALLLAQTYDPAVLGTPETRSIIPDPARRALVPAGRPSSARSMRSSASNRCRIVL